MRSYCSAEALRHAKPNFLGEFLGALLLSEKVQGSSDSAGTHFVKSLLRSG
jgi:hypothetical protein